MSGKLPTITRRSTAYGLIGALSFFVISASTTSVYYLVEQAVNEKGFRDFMQSTARMAALLVDGDLHQTFTREEQHVTQAYKDATLQLSRAVVTDPRIKYIYTYIQKDNTLFYILDPAQPADFDHDGKPDYETPLMLEEDEAPGMMREAIKAQSPMVEKEPSPSLWGPLITAYAPVQNSKGEFVAMLGVDVTARDYYDMVQYNRHMLTIVLSLQFLMSLFVGAMVVIFYRSTLRSRQRLEEAKKIAEAANIAKSEFLANMSHELLTPLHGIMSVTQLMAQKDVPDHQQQKIQTILSCGHALETLMLDMLDLSKLDIGKLPVQNAPFDLPKMLQMTTEMIRPKVEEKKLTLILHAEDGLPKQVVGDENKIKQILINLLGNAIKFTNQGQITLTAKCIGRDKKGATLHFEVSDTGVGFPEDKLDFIFGRFTQMDQTSTRRHGGPGLGLAICKQLAELMGGKVGARSRMEVGSSFWFEVRLPLAD